MKGNCDMTQATLSDNSVTEHRLTANLSKLRKIAADRDESDIQKRCLSNCQLNSYN